VFFLFDLLFLDGEDLRNVPLWRRKERLASLLAGAPEALRYCDHQMGQGPAFYLGVSPAALYRYIPAARAANSLGVCKPPLYLKRPSS
jgi:hypothetical protein